MRLGQNNFGPGTGHIWAFEPGSAYQPYVAAEVTMKVELSQTRGRFPAAYLIREAEHPERLS